MTEIENRVEQLEERVNEVWQANAKYYATRDTAKVDALERVIDNIIDKLLEALKDAQS